MNVSVVQHGLILLKVYKTHEHFLVQGKKTYFFGYK
jgi:hypothetical protein